MSKQGVSKQGAAYDANAALEESIRRAHGVLGDLNRAIEHASKTLTAVLQATAEELAEAVKKKLQESFERIAADRSDELFKETQELAEYVSSQVEIMNNILVRLAGFDDNDELRNYLRKRANMLIEQLVNEVGADLRVDAQNVARRFVNGADAIPAGFRGPAGLTPIRKRSE